MHRNILHGGLAIFLVSVLFLSSNQVGRADRLAEPSLSSEQQQEHSLRSAKNDDCEKDKKGKNKDKCKGTVKPPKSDVIIPVTGSYSVGGFCTLSVEFTDPAVDLNATLMTPLPGELPGNIHKPGQGCLLTYYRSGETLSLLSPASGSVTICFAPTVGKQMAVYYYDLYSANPAWAALPETTTLENGIICAPADASGVYIATYPL